jgi:hypothetical protein
VESKRIESPLEAVKNNGPGENVFIGIGLKFIVTTGLTKLEVLLTRIALPGQALAAMAAVSRQTPDGCNPKVSFHEAA